MASAVIADLDSQLASLNQLKPPGASKTRIGSITLLCVNNVQAESAIVQSLYRAVKKAPTTHKLGAIYVIDSVVRRWIEMAKQLRQDLNIEGRGEAGTYPAAVRRVTELMPALFDDIVRGIPTEQKEKLEGMIKIWERGGTFPSKLLADCKVKLGGTPNQADTNNATAAPRATTGKFSAPIPSRPTDTPVGFPPQHLYDQGLIPKQGGLQRANRDTPQHAATPSQQSSVTASAPPRDVNSILATLAVAAPQPSSQQGPRPLAPPQQGTSTGLAASLAALFGQQNAATAQPTPNQQQVAFTPHASAHPYQIPPHFSNLPPQQPPSIPQQYAAVPPPPQQPPAQQQADVLGPLRHILPPNIINDQQKLIQALKLLQDLQKDGVPPGAWAPVLKAFEEQYQPPAPTPAPTYTHNDDYNRARERSRSPERGGPKKRPSPVYGTYEEVTARKQTEDDRQARGGGGNRNRYRQRSPVRGSPIPTLPPGVAMNGNAMQPKYIAIDSSLPRDNIKVLSRTLFVGGANGTQQEIHELFSRFGKVQTCIANREKRHAFVKMTTRQHALAAKAGLERIQASNDREVTQIARQTKWGVGFGPRECCDYTQGESIIPIHKLTEADVKWLLTAEFGGTGGQKIEAGMVLEEPDIEIGAGVSSKAMSKRVVPDAGPPSKRQREEGGGQRHGRNDRGKRHNHDAGHGGYSGVTGGGPQQQPMPMEAYGYARPEPVAVATPPAVPGFGFTLPGQPTYR